MSMLSIAILSVMLIVVYMNPTLLQEPSTDEAGKSAGTACPAGSSSSWLREASELRSKGLMVSTTWHRGYLKG